MIEPCPVMQSAGPETLIDHDINTRDQLHVTAYYIGDFYSNNGMATVRDGSISVFFKFLFCTYFIL